MSVNPINIPNSNITGNTYTVGAGGGGAGGGGIWTTGPVYTTNIATGAGGWLTSDGNIGWNQAKPVIQLNGKEADIVIDGKSLKDAITAIEDRLAILKPNPKLEAKWDRLRELREEYQRLEKEIMEKESVWNALK